ncbi:MAG: hypothetical protein A3C55_03520 [Gammaproteobacteria bacterium RIFCSPHIGHO2_02_FULL_42_13]|nr:MAG: hypothetical protein A3C55_03520 [Gammaproteobacteria bacterium RIFCSPHIGHO2_02_FULL_42_13]
MYKILTIKNKRLAAAALVGWSFLSMQGAMASSVFLPNGFYLSGGSMDGYVKANNVKLDSGQTNVPLKTSVSRFGSGGFFALGYGFASTPVRLAFEYTHRPKVSYSTNPIFQSATEPQKINSTLFNSTMIFNAYYDFHFFSKISPLVMFLKGGIGYARNRTSSRITYAAGSTPPSTAGEHVRDITNTYAWDAGLGLRYRLTSNIFVSLAGQYVDSNTASWGAWYMGGAAPQNYTLKAHRLSSIEGVLSLDIFLGKQQQPLPGLINDGNSSKNPALINDDLQEDTVF